MRIIVNEELFETIEKSLANYYKNPSSEGQELAEILEELLESEVV